MAGKFTVSLGKIIDEFHLETIYMPKDPAEILIDENDVTRPGLQLMGFYEYFNPERMQIIGKMEFAYLSTIDEETRTQRLDALMSRHIPALIIARELPYFSEMLDLAKKYEVPLLRSKESTSNFISGLIAFLNLNLAPRITRHGVLIEIYGEGVFITGESGVGKSETAIELVKRGHRLVADDAVEIRKVSNISLVGSSPDNIRHFLELRGQEARTSLNKTSILARKLTSVYAQITTKMEFVPEVHQHSAGLILYYDNMNYINLRKYYSETLGQSAISIIQLENGEKTEFVNTRIPVDDVPIYFRLVINGRHSQFYWSYDGENYEKIGIPFDTTKFSDEYCKYGEFTGTMVGITCADRVKHQHYADFDFFEYKADETKNVE